MTKVSPTMTVQTLKEALSHFRNWDHIWVNDDGNISIFRDGTESSHFVAEINIKDSSINWEYTQKIEPPKNIINTIPYSGTIYRDYRDTGKPEFGKGSYAISDDPHNVS